MIDELERIWKESHSLLEVEFWILPGGIGKNHEILTQDIWCADHDSNHAPPPPKCSSRMLLLSQSVWYWSLF
jgi:hypothetical protein